MKNKEKYLDKMLTVFNENESSCFFKKKYVIKNCDNIGGCNKCEELFKTWLEEEYIEPEPEINWEEVPYNTKVYVRDDKYSAWELRTFICYKPELSDPFICIGNVGSNRAVGWKLAELVDEEDIERFKKRG